MAKVNVKSIVKNNIVTAFTIAAALMWVEFLKDALTFITSPIGVLVGKFFAAVIATIFVIIGIYTVLKTEEEAEALFKRFNGKQKS